MTEPKFPGIYLKTKETPLETVKRKATITASKEITEMIRRRKRRGCGCGH